MLYAVCRLHSQSVSQPRGTLPIDHETHTATHSPPSAARPTHSADRPSCVSECAARDAAWSANVDADDADVDADEGADAGANAGADACADDRNADISCCSSGC